MPLFCILHAWILFGQPLYMHQWQRTPQVWEMCPMAIGKWAMIWSSVSSPLCPMVGALGRFGWTVQAREALSVHEYCVVGNHKLKATRLKGNLQNPELLVSETCSLVKAATPQDCPTCLGAHGCFVRHELQITHDKSHLQVR